MNFVCKYLLCPHKVVPGPCDWLAPKGIETLASKETLISCAFSFGCLRQNACEKAADTESGLFPVWPFVSQVIYMRASRMKEAVAHSSLTPEMKGSARNDSDTVLL